MYETNDITKHIQDVLGCEVDHLANALFIGDLHTGVREDDPWQEEIIRKTVEEMIEYSKANGITLWIQTGDWFDVRRAITHRTMEFNRTVLMPMLDESGIHCIVVVGNHDMHYKNTIQPNAPREQLAKYSDCWTVVDFPTTIQLGSHLMDLIPWMCEGNSKQIMDFVKSSVSELCLGHWELNGFYFYKNQRSTGFDPDFLKAYKRVYSGHFHTISEGGNVQYLGTPFTITANDEDEQRGFWHFKDGEMVFVANSKCYHRSLTYPQQDSINPKEYENCAVRLIATVVDDGLTKLETELSKVVHSLRTINKATTVSVDSTAEIDDKPLSVIGLLIESIDDSELGAEDKDGCISIIRELETEASQL